MRVWPLCSFLVAALAVGCTSGVSHKRILKDAENEFYKVQCGLQIHDSKVESYLLKSPKTVSAEVVIISDRPLGSSVPRAGNKNLGKYYYTLNYKKLKSGWELIRVKEGSLTD
ncbi:MAG: hypothetical protein E3J72_18930 [Planctomycetota bacterium]|nr:MAG: hypothetical protein E3J72_18930 [Planctomycetota bacterium]